MHPFDQRHGVDTSGLLYPDRLPSGHPHDAHSEGYYATAPSVVSALIARWAETLPALGLSLEDYTLLDLGCGKGRVLMLASQFPFESVIGIELHPMLARIARRNLARWMRTPHPCRDVHIVHGDVLSTQLPNGPVVLFCFNSFGREIVRRLLERLVQLARTRTQPIDLLYVHPEHSLLVDQTPGMELLFEEDFPFDREDAEADVFEVDFDRCSAYRLRGWAQR